MDDVVKFMAARLEEEEVAAKAGPTGPWYGEPHEADARLVSHLLTTRSVAEHWVGRNEHL
ncbi:hypothetical protein [Ornithinimicrobium cerasi]|uniref:Uncharacterized protein n=1 Tax=Ornithinimicrobium cerasi TaxID=2248773 RepID=A0A285VW66_9MICO|nr:hypothetical protein [Ornithinimicrobium cerasi]SOC58330.1 hypothetical protein SAMN05421879_1299 [Ornithinimicrobium cerasi]